MPDTAVGSLRQMPRTAPGARVQGMRINGLSGFGCVLAAVVVLGGCGSGGETPPPDPENQSTVSIASGGLSVSQSAGSVAVTVQRSGDASGAAQVSYTTENGTASAGVDYTPASGLLAWSDGDAVAKTINVPISNAVPFDGARTFTVSLSGATNAALATPAQATVTISGSGAAPPDTPGPPNAGAGAVQVDRHILVDQFGYRPSDPKVAVIRNPQNGYDAADRITPGTVFEVRRAADGVAVASGGITAWNGGATQDSSGDQGWWFDFSAVTTPGTYFVHDVQRARRSPTFVIAQQVYKPVLKAAVKMFYYQRSGFAKTAQFAGGWADGAAYVGPGQDLAARDVTDEGNAGKQRNLSGGWFDAGDTNQYVTFANSPVHQLLQAYQDNPAVFTDDFDIPESGNGIPDLIDEVKFEIDWLKKMQFANGGVALKLGVKSGDDASPPSHDTKARFYVPPCTSSTIAAASMFAHAAHVYAGIPALAGEVADLRARAINAWNSFHGSATRQTNCDTGAVRAGDADWPEDTQNATAVVAAVWLFAATGEAVYHDYVKANYSRTYLRPFGDIGWSRYQPEQGEALLFYTTLPGADATVRTAIRQRKQADVANGYGIYGAGSDDLYRAYLHDAQYHWGSHQVRANYGNTNVDAALYGLAGGSEASMRTRALDTLHYFHGVNPLGTVYLTNMSAYGASSSLNAIFSVWFKVGSSQWGDVRSSTYGPPPGYVPGGPNASTGVWLAPPAGQPRQKAYRDWNGDPVTGDPQQSWEITEPGIYYQAAFVKLVAAFAR